MKICLISGREIREKKTGTEEFLYFKIPCHVRTLTPEIIIQVRKDGAYVNSKYLWAAY